MTDHRRVPTTLDPTPGETIESLTALAGSARDRVQARGSDLTSLEGVARVQPQAVTARVLIDQAEDLRRSLVCDRQHVSQLLTSLMVAQQAFPSRRRPRLEGTQDVSAVVGAAISGAVRVAGALAAAAQALELLAQGLVDAPDLPATADLSAAACRRHLVSAHQAAGELADRLGTLRRVVAGS